MGPLSTRPIRPLYVKAESRRTLTLSPFLNFGIPHLPTILLASLYRVYGIARGLHSLYGIPYRACACARMRALRARRARTVKTLTVIAMVSIKVNVNLRGTNLKLLKRPTIAEIDSSRVGAEN